MVVETRSPEETFAVGVQLGMKAAPGQVYTLTGDLGVGKTVFTQGFAKGLGIEEPVIVRHLLLYRSMKMEGFRFTILMYTVLVMWKRWKKSVLKIM